MKKISLLLIFVFFPLFAQVKKGTSSGAFGSKKQFKYITQKAPKILKGGKLISINLQSSRISNVIRLFQEKTGLNIIASDKIVGSFTAYVKQVPSRDILRNILAVNNLYFIEDENANLIRIVTKAEYIDYAANHLIRQKIYNLSSSKAQKIGRAIYPLMTKGISRLLIDEKNNRLIVSDFPERLEKITGIIEAFVKPPKQIEIECNIVEIELSDGYEFGLDWSVLDIPNVITKLQSVFIPRSDSDPNIPANQGLSIFRSDSLPDGNGTVEALMHLLATDLKLHNVANPKIITQQNQRAEIHVGRQIPYNETNIQGLTGNQSSSFKFLDTGTKLIITPQITKGNDVQLTIDIEISSSPGFIEFGKDGASGKAPEKISTSVHTNVLIKNKGMIIIGGLIKSQDKVEMKGIPILKDIPILKYLFSYRKVSNQKTESVIFIKPRIIDKAIDSIPKRFKEIIEKSKN